MEFREIKIGELKEFIQSDWFKNTTDLPITTHRALSHIENPRAKQDDVCLILALDDHDQLMGYIGILPDHFPDTETRFGWLSCWWTHPVKGKQLGLNLFLQALIVWDYQFVITDFTPHIKTIISNTRMFAFAPHKLGVRGYIGFNLAEILPRKKAFFRKVKFLLICSDMFLNQTNSLRVILSKRRFKNHGLDVEELDRIDESDQNFILQHQQKEYFKRSAPEINWMLEHPWVLENGELPWQENKKYYFSSTDLVFKYRCLRFRFHSKTVGVAILRLRNQSFTLPYIYYNRNFKGKILAAIYHFVLRFQAIDFTVFHPEMASLMRETDNPFLFSKDIPKDFAVSNSLASLLNNERFLQDGDGDYAFT